MSARPNFSIGAPGPVAAFTGTSTGKVYEVGKLYQSAGDVYRANEDMSFTNLRTGRTNVGSSQSEDVTFWRGPASLTAGPGNDVVESRQGESPSGGAGPGSARVGAVVSAHGGGGSGVGASAQVSFQRGQSLGQITGGGGPGAGVTAAGQVAVKIDPLYLSGFRIEQDPNTSNAEAFENRFGDSEVLALLYGTYIFATDALHTVQREKTKVSRWVGGKWDEFNAAYDAAHDEYRQNGVFTTVMPPLPLNLDGNTPAPWLK